MKAVSGDLPAASEAGWTYEIKWDGMRVLGRCADGAITFKTTNGLDATGRFPELAGLADAIGCDAVVDGEVVAIDDAGRPDFGRLQHRMHLTNEADVRRRMVDVPVQLALFDLLWLDGNELCPLPLRERRPVLEALVEPAPRWRVPSAHDDGVELLDIADKQGLEGVMAKRLDSPYLPGQSIPGVAQGQGAPAPGVRGRRLVAGREGQAGPPRQPHRRCARSLGAGQSTALRREGRHRLHQHHARRVRGTAGAAGHRPPARSTRRRPRSSPSGRTGSDRRSSSRSRSANGPRTGSSDTRATSAAASTRSPGEVVKE